MCMLFTVAFGRFVQSWSKKQRKLRLVLALLAGRSIYSSLLLKDFDGRSEPRPWGDGLFVVAIVYRMGTVVQLSLGNPSNIPFPPANIVYNIPPASFA